MQDAIQRQIESVIQCRRHLAEVESKRGQYKQNVPAEIWQEFVEVSHRLEQAEEKVRQTCQELAGDVNQIRAEIASTMEQYNHWREQMRQAEDLFLMNIVRPGRRLKQAIRQREYLEREYQRINTGIKREGYANLLELETDIHRVLTHGDTSFKAEAERSDDEFPQDEYLFKSFDDITVDDLVEAISKEELVREFKRVVLPAVHPDTSDTPAEVFNTVHKAYKKGDYLLMEAYIVEYRGEIRSDTIIDPLESLDEVLKIQQRYQRLSARMQRRVGRLKQDLTTQEMEDPGKMQEKMQRQRQEIIVRIQTEAEQILLWRAKIESLMQNYRECYEEAQEE